MIKPLPYKQDKPISSIELRNKVLMVVRQSGPVLPVNVSKATGKNTIFIGAMLSELIAQKMIRITACKIGGSPLYYAQGQEPKLTMIRDYLSQKPKQAFDMLRESKVLRDNELEPSIRVAMREIKDFAVPLQVTSNNNTEIFWRWYMLNAEEANRIIGNVLNPKIEPEEPETVPAIVPIVPIVPKPESISAEIPEAARLPEQPEHKKHEQSIEKHREAKPKHEKAATQTTFASKEGQKKIVKSPLRDKALELFEVERIRIIEEFSGKKTECSFVIAFASQIGELKYLAIAKSKKRLNDDDVQLAFASGIQKRLPVLLLGKDLAKSAEKSAFEKGISFKKL